MLTRLRYLPDETLHSFIFRVCLINGEEQFSDVTNNNVQWLKTLQINARTMKYFADYSDRDFLILTRNSWQAVKNTKMFGNPVEYMSQINILLRKQPIIRRGTHTYPLRYCIDCIRESIKELGFGYFKSSWHYDFANYCYIHHKTLTHFNKISKMHNHETLKAILRGEHPAGSYSLNQYNTQNIEKNVLTLADGLKPNELPSNNEGVMFIAECLKEEIKSFIRTCPFELPKMALISDSFNKTPIIKPYKEHYIFQDYVLAKIIRCLFNEKFEPFISFWQKNASKKIVYCGVVKPTDIYEFLFIHQSTDKCNGCEHFSCPVKNHLTEDAQPQLHK